MVLRGSIVWQLAKISGVFIAAFLGLVFLLGQVLGARQGSPASKSNSLTANSLTDVAQAQAQRGSLVNLSPELLSLSAEEEGLLSSSEKAAETDAKTAEVETESLNASQKLDAENRNPDQAKANEQVQLLQKRNQRLEKQQKYLLEQVLELRKQVKAQSTDKAQSDRLAALEEEREKLTSNLSEAGDTAEKRQRELKFLAQQFVKFRDQAEKDKSALNEEKSNLQKKSAEQATQISELSSRLATQEEAAKKLPEVEEKLKQANDAVSQRDQELNNLRAKVKDQEEILASLPGLKRELVAAKNLLLMKEKEEEILLNAEKKTPEGRADTREDRRKPAVKNNKAEQTADLNRKRDKVLEASGRMAGSETLGLNANPLPSDVTIVEVQVAKAALRAGPSPDDAEIMQVGKGSRLVVEESVRDWYRVVTPNSKRAFVRNDMVAIVSGNPNSGKNAMAELNVANGPEVRAGYPAKPPIQAIKPGEDFESFGKVNQSGPKELQALDSLKNGLNRK